jgi:hypothetical protein
VHAGQTPAAYRRAFFAVSVIYEYTKLTGLMTKLQHSTSVAEMKKKEGNVEDGQCAVRMEESG